MIEYDLQYNWKGTRHTFTMLCEMTPEEIQSYVEHFGQYRDRENRATPAELKRYMKAKGWEVDIKNVVSLRSRDTIIEYELESGDVLKEEVKQGYV